MLHKLHITEHNNQHDFVAINRLQLNMDIIVRNISDSLNILLEILYL